MRLQEVRVLDVLGLSSVVCLVTLNFDVMTIWHDEPPRPRPGHLFVAVFFALRCPPIPFQWQKKYEKVFVSNLAYEVQWQDLKDYMRNAGSVLRADIIVGPDGRSKGLGTVEFSKPYEVRWTACFEICVRLAVAHPLSLRVVHEVE